MSHVPSRRYEKVPYCGGPYKSTVDSPQGILFHQNRRLVSDWGIQSAPLIINFALTPLSNLESKPVQNFNKCQSSAPKDSAIKFKNSFPLSVGGSYIRKAGAGQKT